MERQACGCSHRFIPHDAKPSKHPFQQLESSALAVKPEGALWQEFRLHVMHLATGAVAGMLSS